MTARNLDGRCFCLVCQRTPLTFSSTKFSFGPHCYVHVCHTYVTSHLPQAYGSSSWAELKCFARSRTSSNVCSHRNFWNTTLSHWACFHHIAQTSTGAPGYSNRSQHQTAVQTEQTWARCCSSSGVAICLLPRHRNTSLSVWTRLRRRNDVRSYRKVDLCFGGETTTRFHLRNALNISDHAMLNCMATLAPRTCNTISRWQFFFRVLMWGVSVSFSWGELFRWK